ncbi:unannotated protein [freshwater metagenome]|uniref:Unannotated protein n=1 Tax=freshwater metagenome TaxID=449393 RepID=A0A6J7C9B5_9ZZZZ
MTAAHMRAHRLATRGCVVGQAGTRAECQHRTVHVAGLQRLQRAPPGVGTGDDDGLQRFTQRRLDRRLPAFIDLDQVEQRAQHTVDTCQMLCTGACTGTFQRLVQRLGTGLPT